MGVEIERKFLVDQRGFRPTGQGVRLVQGYLSTQKTATIRVRVASEQAWLTIKGETTGFTRREFEYPIPLQDAEEMLSLCADGLVEKTRYREKFGNHVWEVDVFEGNNAGLVLAEIELDAETQPYDAPPWLGPEVTRDFRYSNSSLARHPYGEWSAEERETS